MSDDVGVVGRMILQNEEGEIGEICSGLHQDFSGGGVTSVFEFRHSDGSRYRVCVSIIEIDCAEEDE